MELPSIELLSESTGMKISKSFSEVGITSIIDITIDDFGTNLNFRYQDEESCHLRYLNIYEFEYMLRKWAYSKGYNILISSHSVELHEVVPKNEFRTIAYWNRGDVNSFSIDYTYVIEACEWVLKKIFNESCIEIRSYLHKGVNYQEVKF